jgi:alkylhydroperoxidase family enzyme
MPDHPAESLPAAGRFSLPPSCEWSDAQTAAFDAIRTRRGKVPLPHRILLGSPEVALRFEALSTALQRGSLPRRVQEFVFLFVGSRPRCEHLWRTHVAKARAEGLDDATIEQLAQGRIDALPGDLAEIAAALESLRRDGAIADARFDRLRQRFGTGGVAELVLLAGLATSIAYLLNARLPD